MLVHFIVMIVKKKKCLFLKNSFEEKKCNWKMCLKKRMEILFPPPSPLGLFSPAPPRALSFSPSWATAHLVPFSPLSHPLTDRARLSASSPSTAPSPLPSLSAATAQPQAPRSPMIPLFSPRASDVFEEPRVRATSLFPISPLSPAPFSSLSAQELAEILPEPPRVVPPIGAFSPRW